MQFLFEAECGPEPYAGKCGLYPEAPKRCPHKDCGLRVEMKKHGFYRRHISFGGFKGYIRVRRYKCPACGRTLSMMPAFCMPRFHYGLESFFFVMRHAAAYGIHAAAGVHEAAAAGITRRHIQHWRARIRKNRRLIAYGMMQMSPADKGGDPSAGDATWTEWFLGEAGAAPQKFSADFHKTMGKSFMSLHNSVA